MTGLVLSRIRYEFTYQGNCKSFSSMQNDYITELVTEALYNSNHTRLPNEDLFPVPMLIHNTRAIIS